MGLIKFQKVTWPLLLVYLKTSFKKQTINCSKPGTQSRRFTHIDDTIDVCMKAWKKDLCKHYSISHKKSYKIIEVARMFKKEIKFLPFRSGERYVSHFN